MGWAGNLCTPHGKAVKKKYSIVSTSKLKGEDGIERLNVRMHRMWWEKETKYLGKEGGEKEKCGWREEKKHKINKKYRKVLKERSDCEERRVQKEDSGGVWGDGIEKGKFYCVKRGRVEDTEGKQEGKVTEELKGGRKEVYMCGTTAWENGQER